LRKGAEPPMRGPGVLRDGSSELVGIGSCQLKKLR